MVAEESCRTALTATSETSFDGAYEVIDALVKTTFGRRSGKSTTPAAQEQAAFDDYIEEAILRLAETGTAYSSNPPASRNSLPKSIQTESWRQSIAS